MENKEEKEEEIQELIFIEFAIKRSKYECKVYIYQGFEKKASSVGANKSVEQSFYQKRARTNRLRFVD